jgi:hypothetical protein
MANEKLIVELSAQIQGLKAGLDNASKEISKFNTNTNNAAKNSEKDFSAIGSAAGKVGGIVAGAFAAGSILSLGKSIVETTAKFETFAAVLTNTLGSASQAQMAMQMITDFAAKTPFSVEELTGAFVKLANQGFKPSYDEMRKLGDLASSTGKSFGQLAEAILDAQTGEFERLKEFGVKAKVAGDQVTFSFKGVATTVSNTADSIQKYLLTLGDVEGVSGSMAAISATLTGKISNLGDSWTTLMKNMGDSNSGVLKTTVDRLTQIISALNTIGHADNIAEKLGIDQRGKNWMDNIPFAEMQNLWGGVTFGQQGNINLVDSYDKLNAALAKIKTSGGFSNFIASLEQAKTAVGQTSPYYKIYAETINNAKDALAALTAEQAKAAAKAKAAADLAASIRKPGKPMTYVAPTLGIKQIPNAPVELGLIIVDEEKRQAARKKELAQIAQKNALLEQQNTILGYSTLLVNTLQSGFEQMFTTLIDGGQNAFQGLFNAIKQLIVKLLAAIAVASILFVLSGGLSSGGNALQKIGEIAKGAGGLGFNPFTIFTPKPATPYIAMPSNTTGQGGYQVDIMGDKMRLLLDNQAIKNSRVV